MTREQMQEYLLNGGKLFNINAIDTIRDGGTKVLETSIGKFFINKDTKNFHSGYSPSNENLITDFLLIEYLIEKIQTYIKRCEDDVERNKTLLLKIKNNIKK